MDEWMNTETTAAQASSAVETELSWKPWSSGVFSAGPLKHTLDGQRAGHWGHRHHDVRAFSSGNAAEGAAPFPWSGGR